MGACIQVEQISGPELQEYIEKHANLWAMLAVNLNLNEERCREIALDVACALVKAQPEIGMTAKQFSKFGK